MNLEKINLNLLVAFDALLAERQVTKAARKLFITQSAMSIALAQLRELLKDDILIRGPKGMMIPTVRALKLQPKVRKLLEEIKSVIYAEREFNPAIEKRTFRIGMTDYPELVLLPRLLEKIAKTTPNISLKIINLNLLDQYEMFETEQLDLAIGVLFEKNVPLMTERLFSDTAVCVARKGHPLMKKRLTLKSFLQAKHIAINLHSAPALSRIDRVLQDLGFKRDIALELPHMIPALYIVAHSDYLLACMKGLADELVQALGLCMQELPFVSQPLDILMAWPKQYISDPAHCWLRSMIREL